ncbi:MAG: hypothetical protein ACLR5G_03735 [Eubacteriales bacterium]
MKRILIVLLLAAQLLAAVSCGGDSGEKVPSGGSDRTEDTSAEETTSFYDSIDIPDFSGKSFTILARTNLIRRDVRRVGDRRDRERRGLYSNCSVSERLNIDLNVIDQPGRANKDERQYVAPRSCLTTIRSARRGIYELYADNDMTGIIPTLTPCRILTSRTSGG